MKGAMMSIGKKFEKKMLLPFTVVSNTSRIN